MSTSSPPTLETLREAMTRATNREGIPMVVALVDERGTIPAVTDPAVRNTGATIAHQIQHVRDDLAPSMADGDNGGVINALVIAAHDLTDLGAHSG